MTENWLLWALLSATFAALTAICAKLGLRDVDPDVAQAVRTAVVLIAVLLFLAATQKWRAVATLDGRSWRWLIFAGLATAASWMCYFRALKMGDASRVQAVDKLSLVLIAVFAALALGESLGRLGWLGVVLVTAGAFLISQSK